MSSSSPGGVTPGRLVARRPVRRPVAGDLIAGISVAIVLIPQSLAYAQLAGMPAYRGLYAAALPPIAAALFACSPYLQTGPVALTSLLAFGALSALAPPGSAEYVRLGILLALVVGVARLVVGLARAGVIAYLVSQPMLLGFMPAAAILIVASQLPTALGVTPDWDGIIEGAAWALTHPGSWDVASLLLAAGVVALMLGGRLVHPLFPSVPIAVACGLVVSGVGDYDGATVGPIPGGLPPLSLDMPWGDLPTLVLPGVVIALVGFVEPSAIARTYAALDRQRWDADREFLGQGAANVAAAVSGGFPVGGSFSRSALARLSGARTRWNGAVAGLAVLVFVPFASFLEPLPRAVLGGVVIGSVLGLIRIRPILRLLSFSRPQFVVAGVTFVLTLALSPHIEQAIVIGIGLAVATHLFRELSLDVVSWTENETLHLRPRGVLWFGTAPRLEDSLLDQVAQHPDARSLVIHLDAVGRIDTTAALSLRSLLQDARAAGLDARIGEIRPRWARLVERVIESPDDPV
ncbi:MAG TPA: SulP family inorganic anion transporter [Gaiellaceae bacterium]